MLTIFFIGLIAGILASMGVMFVIAWFINHISDAEDEKEGVYDEVDTCWECSGAGWMIGDQPCRTCLGTGTIPKGQMAR